MTVHTNYFQMCIIWYVTYCSVQSNIRFNICLSRQVKEDNKPFFVNIEIIHAMTMDTTTGQHKLDCHYDYPIHEK